MKKAVVLVVVFGVMLVISALALVSLNFMTQESRVAEHKIRRIRGFYAAEAGKVDALERLRRNIAPSAANIVSGVFPPTNPAAPIFVYHVPGIGFNAGTTIPGYPVGGLCVKVTIYARPVAGRCTAAAAPSEFCIDAESTYATSACPP